MDVLQLFQCGVTPWTPSSIRIGCTDGWSGIVKVMPIPRARLLVAKLSRILTVGNSDRMT
jgi:hypothetical protein